MDAATPRPGRIGPYEIRLSPPGPRSRTYKGVDPLSQRSVALKAIPKHLLDGERIAKLKQEVSAAARLEHQGIVRVFEYGEDHEWAYVAREFVEGWPIKERRRIPVGDGVAVMAQLLEALDYAHARGVVHGDLRPSNLLLTSKGLKVAGFGTEVAYAEVQPWLTAGQGWRRGFVERFESRLKDPEFRRGVEAHLSAHPEWDPILHPEKYDAKTRSSDVSQPQR